MNWKICRKEMIIVWCKVLCWHPLKEWGKTWKSFRGNVSTLLMTLAVAQMNRHFIQYMYLFRGQIMLVHFMTAYILKLLVVLAMTRLIVYFNNVHSFLLWCYFTKVFEESLHLFVYIMAIVVSFEDGRYLFQFLSTAIWPDKFTVQSYRL